MDEIRFPCEVCGRSLAAAQSAVGRRIVCPSCNGLTTVPDAQAPPEVVDADDTDELTGDLGFAPQAGAAEAAAVGGAVATRVCSRCGAVTRLGMADVGTETKCAVCWAPLPPGPDEAVQDMEYPDRRSVVPKVAAWGLSVALHCLLFLSLTGVTWLPSRGGEMDKGPVGIAEEDDEPSVSVQEAEPPELLAPAGPPELTPAPDKIEPIPDPDLSPAKPSNEMILPPAIGAGTSRPQQLTIPIIGGGAGTPTFTSAPLTPGGGAATSFKGLLRNRGGSGKRRALERFGGRDTPLAVSRGLAWLKREQKKDGSWGDVGTTGLVLLAFLGDGHTTAEGKYKVAVRGGCKFLLAQSRTAKSRVVFPGRMYNQGIAAFALAEEYAMSRNSRIGKAASGALRDVLGAQYSGGGWRYGRGGQRGDTSVTGWQIMALKAGRDAGLCKPDSAFRKAAGFLSRVKMEREKIAGFGYTSPGMTWNLSAVGLASLQFMRSRNHTLMRKVAAWLLQQRPCIGDKPRELYGLYYATIGMFQMGGKWWKGWNVPMKTSLMKAQHSDGHWARNLDRHAGSSGFPDAYTTALAVLCLEVYYRYAPLDTK